MTTENTGLMAKDTQENTPSSPLKWVAPWQAVEEWLEDMESRWMLPRGAGLHYPRFLQDRLPRAPRVDVIDRAEEICVRAELPGIKKEDLAITVQDNCLTLEARKVEEDQKEEGAYHRHEMLQTHFRRALLLPAPVDAENAKASFKEGIVEVILPKQAGYKATRIAIA